MCIDKLLQGFETDSYSCNSDVLPSASHNKVLSQLTLALSLQVVLPEGSQKGSPAVTCVLTSWWPEDRRVVEM